VVVGAIDGGFFTVDMHRLREAVLAMDWVGDVSIRRSWPDRLSMMVSEQTPLARWGESDLINARGSVFTPSSVEPFSTLVRLSGPSGSELRVVDFYRRIVAGTRQRGLKLNEVELDQRRHWWLRFDGDLTVSLGRERVDHRLAQFLRVYPTLAAQPSRRPQRIDMRYAHGFAVRWHAEAGQDTASRAPSTEDQA
jgi:cell division protein FtsQ